jgi:hypothetical protein
MTVDGGQELRAEEVAVAHKETGFELTAVTPTSSMVGLIVGKP